MQEPERSPCADCGFRKGHHAHCSVAKGTTEDQRRQWFESLSPDQQEAVRARDEAIRESTDGLERPLSTWVAVRRWACLPFRHNRRARHRSRF